MKKISSASKTITEVSRRLSALGGEALLDQLKVNPEEGLNGSDLPDRNAHFGSNFREPLKVKPFCTILKEALDDFMLKVLLVCAVFSLIFDMSLADPHEREHGK